MSAHFTKGMGFKSKIHRKLPGLLFGLIDSRNMERIAASLTDFLLIGGEVVMPIEEHKRIRELRKS